ncbi:MAG TPA: heat-inducible transcriptional repressor HrcA [Vicinamibacterales bacterium]|jgi:heat-inducible transcriptional repressor|nr:heat-inducible transcriptional repressor HrcA [Vicinamibacterales bacterium]
MNRHPELHERDRRILSVLVQAYVDHGEPVSSLWLAGQGFGVSSATLRNILARLEELGFVRQPHTSAGRVPTDLGYRTYVDQLLAERRAARTTPEIEQRLRQAGTVEDLLSHATHEMSRAAHQVGFAVGPSRDVTFQHVDFVLLDSRKVLVVLVSTGGHISHKVVEPSQQYSAEELHEAANYLNTQFRGQTFETVRQAVLEQLREERTLYDQLMARALRLASASFDTLEPQPSIFIQGTSLLLDVSSVEDPETTLAAMRTLMRMMEEKTRLVKLIDACVDGSGLRVVIGTEHGDPELQHFSVVATMYSDGRRTGAVGVIGPTRMRYSRSINAVDSLSRAITRVFDTNS